MPLGDYPQTTGHLRSDLPASCYREEIAKLRVDNELLRAEVENIGRIRDAYRDDRDALQNEYDEVRQGLLDVTSERDDACSRSDALQSLLDERTAEVAELSARLDALQLTCNRLQDRDAYRDWCYRLKAAVRKVENERDMFLSMAAYWFDRRHPGLPMTVAAAVNFVVKTSKLSPGEMIRFGYRKADVHRLERFRRHVTRSYASGRFDPNTKGE